MSNLFSQVLNMSMTGSVVILIVMFVRLILKRSPKIFSYALWSVVLFRLLCPVSFSAPVSILEAFRPEVTDTSDSTSIVYFFLAQMEQGSDIPIISADNQSENQLEQAETVNYSELDIMPEAACIWITGTLVMLLYSAAQYIRLRRKLVGAIVFRENVYLNDYIDTPFVMGILRPKIYLPSNVPMKERKYIIAHEKHHIRRFDHIIKLLAYLALCIHWFNPLVWKAFILAGKDMEMSCDEAVIKRMGSQIRADYSASLLRLATHKKIIAGMPLAFGEGDTKGRVINMANWKKPKLWVSIVCLFLCAAVLVACAVNPAQEEANMESIPPREGTWDGEFKLELPEGYEFGRDELGNMVFTDGMNVIGGKNEYLAPEGFQLMDYFSQEFMQAMGVPEASDESLGYSAGGSMYGLGSDGWVVEYCSDVPPDTEQTVRTFHQFFVMEDGVTIIDVWFDLLKVDNHTKNEILNSIEIPEIGRFAAPSDEQESLPAFSEENINILLTALSDEAENGIPNNFFLLSVHPDLHTVNLAAVLKNTYVSLPDYQGHVTGNNRFAVCYALGKVWGGIEGAEEMVNQCMKDNFDITVDHNMELTSMEFEAFPDILNEILGNLEEPLDPELQILSDRLLSLVVGSDDPNMIRLMKGALASANWEFCTIPFEGTYTAVEMDIAGTMTGVLVMEES